jgi:hypothetical protein
MVPQSVLKAAERMGTCVARGRNVLPELALLVAAETLAGKVKRAHAEDIYLAYYGPIDAMFHTMTPNSLKANTSKLRQIIILVERQGRKGIAILKRAIKDHTALVLQCRAEKIRKPAYDMYGYMVLCAREALTQSAYEWARKQEKARAKVLRGLK